MQHAQLIHEVRSEMPAITDRYGSDWRLSDALTTLLVRAHDLRELMSFPLGREVLRGQLLEFAGLLTVFHEALGRQVDGPVRCGRRLDEDLDSALEGILEGCVTSAGDHLGDEGGAIAYILFNLVGAIEIGFEVAAGADQALRLIIPSLFAAAEATLYLLWSIDASERVPLP